mmetsp:Transcript_5669/g.17963  ORF Transcript_5669/g.17963 Transcript_5669/m.17963 type:complete len:269 (+) Transcript_5669:3474-4280(+)
MSEWSRERRGSPRQLGPHGQTSRRLCRFGGEAPPPPPATGAPHALPPPFAAISPSAAAPMRRRAHRPAPSSICGLSAAAAASASSSATSGGRSGSSPTRSSNVGACGARRRSRSNWASTREISRSRHSWRSAVSHRCRAAAAAAAGARAEAHNCVGLRRVSQRLATPPPSTRETTSSTCENLASSTCSPYSSSTSHASSLVRAPCQAIRLSAPYVDRSCAARSVTHASHMSCCSRGIFEYLRSTYSCLSAGMAGAGLFFSGCGAPGNR